MSEEISQDTEAEEVSQDSAPVEAAAENSQPAAEPAESPPNYWGAFKELPQFQGQDDSRVAMRLYEALQREQSAVEQLQQYQQLIPATSDYLSNRETYQEWLASKQQAQPAPQGTNEKQWWDPPKVRDAYKQFLIRDENGREVIDPNAPLEARHELGAYQAYKANFARQLLENPEQTLGPMVERVAVQRAEAIVTEKLQRMQDEQFVAQLEEENKDWLYDANRQPTPAGVAIQHYILEAKSIGIAGARQRWRYAKSMVERDLMVRAGVGQVPPQQQQNFQIPDPTPEQPAINPSEQRAVQDMGYLRQQAMRTASQRSADSTSARVPAKAMTFEEMFARNLQEQGLFRT